MRPLREVAAEHAWTGERCSCGWDPARFDITSEYDTIPRLWLEHVRTECTPHDKSEIALVTDPEGVEHAIYRDSPIAHHASSCSYYRDQQSCAEYLKESHGAYRFDDYEPPPPDPNTVPSRRQTCEEAGCRDPHCLGGHFVVTLTMPTERCAGCGEEYEAGEERVGVVLRPPVNRPAYDGDAIALTTTYHVRCQPTDDELKAKARASWPAGT